MPDPHRLRQLLHELSQPVTTARSSLELALRLPEADPARAGLLQDTAAALDRVSHLIHQLHALAEQE